MHHTDKPVPGPRSLFKAALLLVACFALGACSHDRYLFLERAELSDLQQQLDAQQARVDALEAFTSQQFDLLETREQMRQSTTLDRFDQLRDRIDLLSRSALAASRQPPISHLQPPEIGESGGRFQGKLIVGEVEPLYLAIPGLIYDARIDSGATTSSLNATNIQRFERDGEPWIRFDLPTPDGKDSVTLERELSRNVRILQSGSEHAEQRAVVELPFMIGDHRQSAEFTLTDRSHLTYPVLIGRNVLRDVMLVDVGQEHLTRLPDDLGTTEGNAQ